MANRFKRRPPVPPGTGDTTREALADTAASPIDAGVADHALACQRYWRFHMRLIGALLTVGALVTFVVPLFARQLNGMVFFGWPVSFYIGAQGAVIIYLAMVVVYVVAMERADARLKQILGADSHHGAPPPPPGSVPPAATPAAPAAPAPFRRR